MGESDNRYEPVIGLEVHVQLNTASKIFCSCATRFGDPPNTHTCPVCLGLPGALPVLNRAAVDKAIRAALGLHCAVRETSVFARKNYFYPDLPKGYQISQYDRPLAEHGWLDLDSDGAAAQRVGITRLHLEEDAGKSMHEGFPDSVHRSYVDLNRAGVPLIEIVSDPDLRSPAAAHEYLNRLKEIMLYLDVSDCNMEEGSLRCDANVSVRPFGAPAFGAKVEIKNLNSFRYLQRALEYEIGRQIQALDSGGRVVQETRLYNSAEGVTRSMRSKEEAHDYRYFPEPDLPPLRISAAWRAEIEQHLPELPQARRQRLAAQYGLTPYDADVLTAQPELAAYFERAAQSAGSSAANAKGIANWVLGDLSAWLNAHAAPVAQAPVPPEQIAALVGLLDQGVLSSKMAKEVFARMAAEGEGAEAAVAALGLKQIGDTAAIQAIIAGVLAANPKQREQYQAGKTALLGFFVGQVMKASQGQANPAMVNDLLRQALEGK